MDKSDSRRWIVEEADGRVRPVDSLWSSITAASGWAPPECAGLRSRAGVALRHRRRAVIRRSPAAVTALGEPLFRRFDALEQAFCLRVNRRVAGPSARRFFAMVSRLGDGPLWYGMLATLPLIFGRAGLHASVQMGVAALVGVAVYLVLKTRLVRERPYITHSGIEAHVPPLDRYSFPSGHTLHAVCFTALATIHFPWLALALVPFTLLVAASRVILGLHYPSDVLAGAAIGAVLAGTVHAIVPA